jgi:hypothetical protein
MVVIFIDPLLFAWSVKTGMVKEGKIVPGSV